MEVGGRASERASELVGGGGPSQSLFSEYQRQRRNPNTQLSNIWRHCVPISSLGTCMCLGDEVGDDLSLPLTFLLPWVHQGKCRSEHRYCNRESKRGLGGGREGAETWKEGKKELRTVFLVGCWEPRYYTC